jgi:Na+-translocating ferredoxin:NAD+ oxidoreductase subunit B
MPIKDVITLALELDAALPQTQCKKCGYQGCKPYAEAMANGEALYNQCPPGGQEGVKRLAHILQQPEIDLNEQHGKERVRHVAIIDENACIGCTLCIQACPVDAIVGAAKHMHHIIENICTGCDLCLEPCPVDCISMQPVTTTTGWQAWGIEYANAARLKYNKRTQRLLKLKNAVYKNTLDKQHQQAATNNIPSLDNLDKKALIEAAMQRARQKLNTNS